MTDTINNAVELAFTLLRQQIGTKVPSEEEIMKAVDDTADFLKFTKSIELSGEEQKKIENIIKAKSCITMDLGTKIIDFSSYKPWLANRKADIEPYYWNRFRDYLLHEKLWNNSVVDSLDKVSDEILNLLGDPKEEGIWKRKGLVLGDIQSGKTSNYTALCNKAADAGYKVIILLTGTLESLRKQTQERIDAGFVGLNSRNVLNRKRELRYIGVGVQDRRRTAYPFTSIIKDFNASILQSLNFTLRGLSEPVVLVIKKNKSVLKNLESWLKTCNTDASNEKIDLPLLLIDDEADNASVNTKKEDEDPTAINEGIRNVLDLFRRSTYVAVTATPFANIFIHPDNDNDVFNSDLFPSDFIYALSPPTNYIGSNAIFGETPKYNSCIELIEDAEEYFPPKHKSTLAVSGLPESLIKAIGYFVIINAVRDLREHKNTHRSMLVNISQFTNVQEQVYDLIEDFMRSLKTSIQNYSKLDVSLALKNNRLLFLYDIWAEYNIEAITGYDWKTIQFALFEAVMPIEIKLVNQKASARGIERLDYELYNETGLRVIAVGGNSLSRGITLEGLCVSYFYRNSQMYDTLMQMGRWFGYRDGYDDLFKIWMSERTRNWYAFITMASNELRDEIRYMNRVQLTPRDFGLKVRQHPESLLVTARNKMRTATSMERWVSLSAKLIETPRLIGREEKIDLNFNTTKLFIGKLMNECIYIQKEKEHLWENVPNELIADYIGAFVSHPNHLAFRGRELSNHIRMSEQSPLWDVVIPGGSGIKKEICGLSIYTQQRKINLDGTCMEISGERARVGSRGCTKAGLNPAQIEEVKKLFYANPQNENKDNIPDIEYLKINRKPLLLIHIIEPNDKSDHSVQNLLKDKVLVAIGLAFPKIEGQEASEKVFYKINLIEYRNSVGNDFEEDDELDEDR